MAQLIRQTPSITRHGGGQLARVERSTALSVLEDRSQSVIASNRLREVDHVVRDAIAGQAVLSHWAQQLAGNDPILHDELQHFVKLARLAKGEVIAGLVDSYTREPRR